MLRLLSTFEWLHAVFCPNERASHFLALKPRQGQTVQESEEKPFFPI